MTLDVRTYRPLVTVQAVRVTHGNCHEIVAWLATLGDYGATAYDGQPAVWLRQDNNGGRQRLAEPGDWIVVGTHGPFVVGADEFDGVYAEEQP